MKMKWKRCIEMMETMITEHVNEEKSVNGMKTG